MYKVFILHDDEAYEFEKSIWKEKKKNCLYIDSQELIAELLKQLLKGEQSQKDNEQEKERELDKLISRILLDLGIPASIKGYVFLRYAIKDRVLCQEGEIFLITKDLYPKVAANYNTQPSRVERAMRHAIEISWNKANVKLQEEIFGCSVNMKTTARPTNTQFITRIADKIRLEWM